ncbi:MAG TPA: DUF2272 domain-containing protein [Methanotrichaceae archaeon]|nr:DUF2272 domain-containing protein [Methanotrichaceae archaeon]
MTAQKEHGRDGRSTSQGNLESPFLQEELFGGKTEAEWETHLSALEAKSPFLNAFEQGRTSAVEQEGDAQELFWDESDSDYAEEFEEYYEEEVPPLLSHPAKSDPPGQTIYVQIDLGKDRRCLERNEKKSCIKRSKPFQIKSETGIFIPENYIPDPHGNVDLLLYLHGHKTSIPGSDALISEYWDAAKYPVFALREAINSSRKNVILVAPTLALKSEAGSLVRGHGLDTYLDKVLEALKSYGPYKGQSTSIGNLILAAHSGAGVYMRMLALSGSQYASKIKECWGLDSLYNSGDVDHWLGWAKLNPGAYFYSYYFTPNPTHNSKSLGRRAVKLNRTNILPIESKVRDHFKLVTFYLGERLNAAHFLQSTRGSSPEMEGDFAPEGAGEISSQEELHTPFTQQDDFNLDLDEYTADYGAEDAALESFYEHEAEFQEEDSGELKEILEQPYAEEAIAFEGKDFSLQPYKEEEDTNLHEDLFEPLTYGSVDSSTIASTSPGASVLEESYQEEAPYFEIEEEVVPVSGLRQRIAEIARQEWQQWGRGTKKETDTDMRDILRGYWENVGLDRNKADKKINKRSAWSAAFVSWVMRKAGAGDAFEYAPAHRIYIAAAKSNRQKGDASKFWAFDITEVKPEVGDLVCRDRQQRGGRCAGTNYSNVNDGSEWPTHSDIVTEVGPGYIKVIGGNVGGPACGKGEGCTVNEKSIKLDGLGYIISDQSKCKYFAIAKPPEQGRLVPSTSGAAAPISSLPQLLLEAVRKGLITLQVAWAMLSGERDVNKLTNTIFFARHPERDPKQKIQPHEKQFAREWLDIRDRIVRPTLDSLRGAPGLATPTEPARPSSAPVTPKLGGNTYFRVANDITGAFEGGKPDTLNLYDRGIISYGKHQATLASGTLFSLLKRYTELSSSETAQRLASYLDRIKKKDESLRDDKAFIQLLKDAAREPEMIQAQDNVFAKEYWEPAKKAAAKVGLNSALGYAIFYDTRIQGGLLQVIEQTLKSLNGKVGSVVRGHQITEQEFLRVFVDERIKRTLRISARQSAEAKKLEKEAEALEMEATTAEPSRAKELRSQAARKRNEAKRNAANARALEISAKKTRGPTFRALVDSENLELHGDVDGYIRLVGKPGVKIRGLQSGAVVEEISSE